MMSSVVEDAGSVSASPAGGRSGWVPAHWGGGTSPGLRITQGMDEPSPSSGLHSRMIRERGERATNLPAASHNHEGPRVKVRPQPSRPTDVGVLERLLKIVDSATAPTRTAEVAFLEFPP